MLNCPYLCMVDGDEGMLIADCNNERLQVRERSGQWSVLDLQPPVIRPNGAVVIDNRLYVSAGVDKKARPHSGHSTLVPPSLKSVRKPSPTSDVEHL